MFVLNRGFKIAIDKRAKQKHDTKLKLMVFCVRTVR